MMNPQWHFNQRRACTRVRDSVNDAFFTAESLENLSEALVREGIQNSLDAARRGEANEREVCVRICFVPAASMLPHEQPGSSRFEPVLLFDE